MTISKRVETFITKSSWIRKMFEEGARLKSEHGAENVFDFSLGNPNLSPPESFHKTFKDDSLVIARKEENLAKAFAQT